MATTTDINLGECHGVDDNWLGVVSSQGLSLLSADLLDIGLCHHALLVVSLNLREAIATYQNSILRQPDEMNKEALLSFFVEYLERYYYLICFVVYLHTERAVNHPTTPAHFYDWMKARPELYAIIRRLLRRDPMGALGYVNIKPFNKMNIGDVHPSEMGIVVFSRTREVLGSQTVLKSDHCSFKDGRSIFWYNMREEPVIYINGKPFVLREVERPYKHMLEYTGIDRERVERMEARPKEDILKESERYGGDIMVIHETEGKIYEAWEHSQTMGHQVVTEGGVDPVSKGRTRVDASHAFGINDILLLWKTTRLPESIRSWFPKKLKSRSQQAQHESKLVSLKLMSNINSNIRKSNQLESRLSSHQKRSKSLEQQADAMGLQLYRNLGILMMKSTLNPYKYEIIIKCTITSIFTVALSIELQKENIPVLLKKAPDEASLRNLYEQVSALKGVEPKKVIIVDLFDEGKETPLPKLSDSNQTLKKANLQMDQRVSLILLLIRTNAAAKKVAFHRQVKTKSVTLEGDLFQPGGLMTGGSVSNNKPPRRARLQAIPGPGQLAPGPAPGLGKKWLTLNGLDPLVVAQGGFPGLFQDSSRAGYSAAMAMGVPGTLKYCNLQLTKDNLGVCLPDIKLDNCTNAATKFPQQQRKYNINGKDVDGWFPLDLTVNDFMKEISCTYSLLTVYVFPESHYYILIVYWLILRINCIA
ncbi:paladin isoform X2 [Tanacetum coccineum]